LKGYAFPGNVRELRNLLERAALLQTGGVMKIADLALPPAEVRSAPAAGPGLRRLWKRWSVSTLCAHSKPTTGM